MKTRALPMSTTAIEAFGRRGRVQELDVFGSVLREDFGPERDVDVLAAFARDALPGLFDLLTMQDELEAIFGRRVDLLERDTVEASHHWNRHEAVLHTVQPICRAA